MDFGIKNKIALVQGASSGLGYAAALELAREGCYLAICSRDETRIQAAAASISESTGATVKGFVCDVTDAQARADVLAKIKKEWGSVDILVANNGGPSPGFYDELTEDQWNQALLGNLLAMKDSAQEVLGDMREQGWGRVVFITSVSVKQPLESLILSNTARAGLTGYAKTLSAQVAEHGITVNMVLPGIHDTDRVRALHADLADPALVARDVPMNRLGRPSELAAMIAFLSSTRASYITGQSIVVDGGMVKSLF